MSRFMLVVVVLLSWTSIAASQDAAKRFGRIVKLDDRLETLIDSSAQLEELGIGFQWSEGPVWDRRNQRLLFSDVPKNKIHQWAPGKQVSVFLEPSGFDQPNAARPNGPGSNGLMFDSSARLIVCDHGNRRVYRLESDGAKTTLADKYDGKRFNSPNDLVIARNGDILFTEPPYGLKDKSAQELDWYGVYRLKPNGKIELLNDELIRPNGIGLSPDEKTLYVAQSHAPKAVYMAYPIQADGTLGDGKVLFDATRWMGSDPGSPDGMAIDEHGNLWATGPGGVLVIQPDGKLLGRIMTGKATANCCFGEDGSTLFITAGDTLCRIKTKTKGANWAE